MHLAVSLNSYPSLILINRLMNIPCGLELLIEIKTLANPLTYLLNKSSRLAKKSDLMLLDYCYYCHDYISSCCSAHYPLLLLFTTATITITRYYDYYYYNDYSSLFYFISLLLILLLCWSCCIIFIIIVIIIVVSPWSSSFPLSLSSSFPLSTPTFINYVVIVINILTRRCWLSTVVGRYSGHDVSVSGKPTGSHPR